jgi:hypothetical protein
VVGTGFLALFVFAVADEFNLPVRANLCRSGQTSARSSWA